MYINAPLASILVVRRCGSYAAYMAARAATSPENVMISSPQEGAAVFVPFREPLARFASMGKLLQCRGDYGSVIREAEAGTDPHFSPQYLALNGLASRQNVFVFDVQSQFVQMIEKSGLQDPGRISLSMDFGTEPSENDLEWARDFYREDIKKHNRIVDNLEKSSEGVLASDIE